MRAVAVAVVVAFHAGVPGFSGGYVGVDVFFVISGYLITWLLLHEQSGSGRISLLGFYARRIRRLLPALALMLIVTSVVSGFLHAPVEHAFVSNSALASWVYASNLYFARVATDYLHAPTDTNPLLHTWSLGVEEQFYFVWPLFLVLLGGALHGSRRFAHTIAPFAIVAIMSYLLSVWLTSVEQPLAFFLPATRAWEFAIGALCALMLHVGRGAEETPPRNLSAGFAGLGIGLLLCAVVLFDEDTAFPGAMAVVPVLGTALLILSTTGGRGLVATILSCRPMLALGRGSYSLYLWHWPALVFLEALIVRPTPVQRALAIAVAVVCAFLSYRLVESPLRSSTRFTAGGSGWIVTAAALSIVGVGSSLIWKRAAADWALDPAQERYTHARADVPDVYARGCHAAFAATEIPDPSKCVDRPDAAGGTVVLFGDSHAAHWKPAVVARAIERDERVYTFTKSACPPVARSVVLGRYRRTYDECEAWREDLLSVLPSLAADRIVLAFGTRTPLSPEAFAEGVADLVAELGSLRADVLVLGPTPEAFGDVPGCLARREWAGRRGVAVECPAPEWEGREREIAEEVEQALAASGAARYVDAAGTLCPEHRECRLEFDGLVVFRDAHHLTTRFAERQTALLDGPSGTAAGARP